MPCHHKEAVSKEHIANAAYSHRQGRALLFIPAKGAEAQPGQVQSEQGQKAVKIHGVPGRTGNAQQVQRIADYIVVQGGENIAAVAQAEVPLGQHQLMFRQQCAQYSTAILAKINKSCEVLFPSVAADN